jgi:hypothetical protein
MEHLPQNHPQAKWANLTVCSECGDTYAPPWCFDDWEAVRFGRDACILCDNNTIIWAGTPDWANPQTLLRDCRELVEETEGTVTFSSDLRERFAKVTRICHECVQSTPEKRLYWEVGHQVKATTLKEPMWEPLDPEDIEIEENVAAEDVHIDLVDKVDLELGEDSGLDEEFD